MTRWAELSRAAWNNDTAAAADAHHTVEVH